MASLMDKLKNNLLVFYNDHRDQNDCLIKIIRALEKGYFNYQTRRADFLKQSLNICIDGLDESSSIVKQTIDSIIEYDIIDVTDATHHQNVKDILKNIIMRLNGCYSALQDLLDQGVDRLDETKPSSVANPMIDLLKYALVTNQFLCGERLYSIKEIVKQKYNSGIDASLLVKVHSNHPGRPELVSLHPLIGD